MLYAICHNTYVYTYKEKWEPWEPCLFLDILHSFIRLFKSKMGSQTLGTQGNPGILLPCIAMYCHVLPCIAMYCQVTLYNAMSYFTHGGIGLLLPATLSDLLPLYPLPRASSCGLVRGCIVRPLDLWTGVSLAVGQDRPKSEPFCGP